MRRKTSWIYLILINILAAVIVSINIHIILEKEQFIQRDRESELPYKIEKSNLENAIIRVVLKTNGFKQITHPRVQISGQQGLVLRSENTQEDYTSGEIIEILPDDIRFQKGTIRVESTGGITIHSLNRGYGIPSYKGSMELYSTAEGIVIVNEIPLEEYLYAVVPSEMPASYELEALKCQAVCARSYAYCQMQVLAYPEYNAHVDDSTAFQVYGNSKVQESTSKAVNETKGLVLTYKDQVVKTYYYSTSCGHSTSVEAWGTTLSEENAYLCGVPICEKETGDYEKDLPWYRWKAVISAQELSNLIELNTGTNIGQLQSVEITKTGVGGVALRITAQGTEGKVSVDTENKIRAALGGGGYKIEKQDGTVTDSKTLLPSAFFTIQKNEGNYIIEGGGYGHGIGMSQNGANEMAKKGKNYEEILQFFYPGTMVK